MYTCSAVRCENKALPCRHVAAASTSASTAAIVAAVVASTAAASTVAVVAPSTAAVSTAHPSSRAYNSIGEHERALQLAEQFVGSGELSGGSMARLELFAEGAKALKARGDMESLLNAAHRCAAARCHDSTESVWESGWMSA